MMRGVKRIISCVLVAACGGGSSSNPDGPPGADGPPPVDAPPPDMAPEPMPAFVPDPSPSGQLAISFMTLFLTEAGAQTGCEFTIAPKFAAFDFGSTSTRQFKTVLYDVV